MKLAFRCVMGMMTGGISEIGFLTADLIDVGLSLTELIDAARELMSVGDVGKLACELDESDGSSSSVASFQEAAADFASNVAEVYDDGCRKPVVQQGNKLDVGGNRGSSSNVMIVASGNGRWKVVKQQQGNLDVGGNGGSSSNVAKINDDDGCVAVSLLQVQQCALKSARRVKFDGRIYTVAAHHGSYLTLHHSSGCEIDVSIGSVTELHAPMQCRNQTREANSPELSGTAPMIPKSGSLLRVRYKGRDYALVEDHGSYMILLNETTGAEMKVSSKSITPVDTNALPSKPPTQKKYAIYKGKEYVIVHDHGSYVTLRPLHSGGFNFDVRRASLVLY